MSIVKLLPPCAYQGGKQRLANQICDIIEEREGSDFVFYDLCCGSGAVSLEMINRGHSVVMIDKGPFGAVWEKVGNGDFKIDELKYLGKIALISSIASIIAFIIFKDYIASADEFGRTHFSTASGFISVRSLANQIFVGFGVVLCIAWSFQYVIQIKYYWILPVILFLYSFASIAYSFICTIPKDFGQMQTPSVRFNIIAHFTKELKTFLFHLIKIEIKALDTIARNK